MTGDKIKHVLHGQRVQVPFCLCLTILVNFDPKSEAKDGAFLEKNASVIIFRESSHPTMCHMSNVMCQVSDVRCHVSDIMYQM